MKPAFNVIPWYHGTIKVRIIVPWWYFISRSSSKGFFMLECVVNICSIYQEIEQMFTTHYFLTHFAQTKTTLFIFWNNWVIKENESFLLVEPCSRVTCCVEIQLKYFFRKYIFIFTIYNLLLQLISAIHFHTC